MERVLIYMKKYSDELIRSWWEQLGDIPVNEDDEKEMYNEF
jgi:hypothetical protein